jgi:hypothetical protein
MKHKVTVDKAEHLVGLAYITNCEFQDGYVALEYTVDTELGRMTTTNSYLWKPQNPRMSIMTVVQTISDTYLPILTAGMDHYIDIDDVQSIVGDRVKIILTNKDGVFEAGFPKKVLQLPALCYLKLGSMLHQKMLNHIAFHALNAECTTFSNADALVGKYLTSKQCKDVVIDLFAMGFIKIRRNEDKDDRTLDLSDEIRKVGELPRCVI